MQYRVAAFKCKVNSMIDLKDDMVPVGVIQTGEDLFVICLDPLEERKLPEEKAEEEKQSEEEKVDKPGGNNGD